MDRTRLVLLRGGKRAGGGAPRRSRASRPTLRVIPGGAAVSVKNQIEEAIEAARRIRADIEARIARALDERLP